MKKFILLFGLVLLIAVPLIAQETQNNDSSDAEKTEKIKVVFGVVPKGLKVNVFHGKTKLGETPFEYEFDRNSGPVDVVFKRPGYFNVNTRVFTYDSSKLIVKMTKRSQASTLHGYKEEIPPDAGIPADGSTPTSMETTPQTAPPIDTPATPETETESDEDENEAALFH